jgi:hypothetical protein
MINGGDRYSYWGDYTTNVNEEVFHPFISLRAGKYMVKAKVRFGLNPI